MPPSPFYSLRGISILKLPLARVAMAIHGDRNKPIGPGGSTRRLHPRAACCLPAGAKQDRRGRKGLVVARHDTTVIGST